MRNIILLSVFCLALLGIVLFLGKYKNRSYKKTLGLHIFSDIPLEKISEIDIISPEGINVTLIRKDGDWIVKEHFGYFADFSQIYELIEKLRGVTVGQVFKAKEDTLKRLSLLDPEENGKEEEKGRCLILKDKEGGLIKKIIFGKAMRTEKDGFPKGQFIRIGDTVYLIDQYFTSLIQGPGEWIKLDLLDIKEDEIGKIKGYKKGKVKYVLVREKGNFKLIKGKLKKDVIEKLKEGLDYLRIDDVVDPSKSMKEVGIEEDSYVEYRLLNGMIIRIFPSKSCKEDECYMKVSVLYEGKEKKIMKEAELMNRKLSPWVYKISKWRHDSFFLP